MALSHGLLPNVTRAPGAILTGFPGDRCNDDDLVRAALERTEAFAPLYERHANSIYGFCYNRSRDVSTANDLTAQIFVRAIERLHQYRPRTGASFRSWLFAIARNIVADHWRAAGDHLPIEPWLDEREDPEPGPEAIVLRKLQLETLLDAMDQLPPRYRDIVELRLAGLTTNEIGDALAITVPALKSAQTRAYRLLRAALSATGEGERP